MRKGLVLIGGAMLLALAACGDDPVAGEGDLSAIEFLQENNGKVKEVNQNEGNFEVVLNSGMGASNNSTFMGRATDHVDVAKDAFAYDEVDYLVTIAEDELSSGETGEIIRIEWSRDTYDSVGDIDKFRDDAFESAAEVYNVADDYQIHASIFGGLDSDEAAKVEDGAIKSR